MRKKGIPFMLILCLFTVFTFTGCGSGPFGGKNLDNYIKMGKYKGLEIKKLEISVSKQEIKEKINANLETTKETTKLTSGEVKDKDSANIDYEGKINGKAFDGGAGEGYDLIIGSDSFIPGFEKSLIGKTIGSTSDIKVTFPKEYQSEDLAGKKATFTVKINFVNRDKIPPYNVAWIKENTEFKSKMSYEQSLKEELIKEKEAQNRETQTGELMQKIVEDTEVIKYPQKEVELYVTSMETQSIAMYKQQYEQQAEQQGVKVEELWKEEGFKTEEEWLEGAWKQQAKSKKEWKKQLKDAAKQNIKYNMIVAYIANEEGLKTTDKEEQEFRDGIKKEGYTNTKVKEMTGLSIDEYIENFWIFSTLGPKVAELVYKNAKIVEAPAKEDKAPDASGPENTDETTDKGADDATSNDEPGGADV